MILKSEANDCKATKWMSQGDLERNMDETRCWKSTLVREGIDLNEFLPKIAPLYRSKMQKFNLIRRYLL